MTSSRVVVLVSTAICLLLASTCQSEWVYEDPHLGAAGAEGDRAVAEAQGEEEGHRPELGGQGEEGHDPDLVFTKALECFGEGYIYKSCDKAYRVSEKGEVEVPHEYTDQYCEGACLKETGLVLDCVEQFFKHFRFYNKASIRDVRATLHDGCSYGPKRGDFNVAEHLRVDEEDRATKFSTSLVYATLLIIMGWHLLF